MIHQVQVPVGAVMSYLGPIGGGDGNSTDIEAYGWMVCDGRSLGVSMYPELFTCLGYLYGGSGDTFNLPDLRGMFLRGIGTDAASTENRINVKGDSDIGVGSKQDFAEQAPLIYTAQPVGPSDKEASLEQVQTSLLETRPVNVFVYYIIKFTYGMGVFST